MAATVLTNAIVPEVFQSYVIERTAELSAIWQSGLVQNVPSLDMGDVNSQVGGKTVHMPFWQDLAGDDQLLDTATNLTVNPITSAQDIAVLQARALVYGAKDLVAALAGSDPMTAIGDLYAAKWARRMQVALLSVLQGAFGALGAETPPKNVFDISGLTGDAANFDAEAFIDAGGRLGDAEDVLAGVLVHSDTLRSMKKQNLIDFIPDSNGGQPIPTYQGKRVIVDDGMPVTSGNYTTFLFAPGAIGYGEGTPKVPSEIERNALVGGGEEYLVSRRHFVLHPRGIKWTGAAVKDTPSNAEIATTANWTRVWEQKHIRMVKFVHKLAA